MAPRPTRRRLAQAAFGALLLAGALGAAYHLIEARATPAVGLMAPRAAEAPPAPHGASGPDRSGYVFADARGRALSLADLAMRPLLVHFWAPWCDPCRNAMPALDRLAAAARTRGDVAVVAIALDRAGAEAVREVYERMAIRELAVYIDESGAALAALGLEALPTTLLLDGERREIGRLVGTRAWEGEGSIDALEREFAARALSWR